MLAPVLLLVCVFYLVVSKYLRSLKVDNFADKYVLITGCDTGFGRALASRLDGLGFHVFAGCLTVEGEKSLSSACSSRLNTVPLDVTNSESVAAALQLIRQKLPADKGIWSLVNNAGVLGNFSPIELCNKEDFVKVFNVNILGPVETITHFLPLIRKASGRVVNITSSSGRFAYSGSPYTASKYAMEALSDILRREVYGQGVKVSIIEPGGYATSITKTMQDEIVVSMKRANPDQKAIYQTNMSKFLLLINRFKKYTPTMTPVIDAYTHAVTSRYPRNRYVIGKDAQFFFIPLSYLPDWMSDWIMRIVFSIILHYTF